MIATYHVHVVTGSKVPSIENIDDTTLKVKLKSRPIDGKANTELVKALATHFKIPQSRVGITRGLTSKHKLVTIELT